MVSPSLAALLLALVLVCRAHGSADPGEPLFLTPLIEAAELQQAREQSRVLGLPGAGANVTSHSGFITVDKERNSNLFFWFFECQQASPLEAPVLLWLQGGPGASSLYGLFAENGPFSVDTDLNLVARNFSWSNTHNLLYIDNPTGTGFSFTYDEQGFARNEEDVARDLYSALTQFFTAFEKFRDNEFYVSGESYAGKYLPAIVNKIHVENPTAEVKINLKGMAIGDGFVDPINQVDYSEYFYNVGLVDAKQSEQFHDVATQTVDLINQGDLAEAFLLWDTVLIGTVSPYPTLFQNITGFTNQYNYLQPNDAGNDPFNDFLKLPATRASIHVGNLPYNEAVDAVIHYMISDEMNTTKPLLASALDAGYRVLIYSGQLDICVPYPLTQRWLASMEWHGAEQYRDAERVIWRERGEIAGYVRQVDNLYEVLVRNSGHMVPTDQPEVGYALITRFTGTYGAQGWQD
ncbi:venom serine carboxypeptidase-like [Amphibalanus amphitrite]|uniref:venom serine carboxypeptidase-like n=1 Tax=Amphibalanus amphitrite TaxID=1232801 RepID=UPI001C906C97|nr:venom serine carboxypeptidase-like [Amphibalanus amphitrite]XP_043226138.1 venom serine carboxypeptidase-like [Amphibalanus amphitrite]